MNNSFTIDMVVEIPKGGCNKYEYDVLEKTFKLDRVLPGADYYPGEYGFIKNTLDFDGDPLDVIALSTYPTFPGCIVTVRVLGEIYMIDEGKKDTKLFGVLDNDPRFNHITSIDQVSKHLTDPIINFFQNYKNLQNKKVEVSRTINKITKAQKTLHKCQKLFNKYEHLIQNNQKKELMSKLHQEQKRLHYKKPKKKQKPYDIYQKEWIQGSFPRGEWLPIIIKTNMPDVSVELFTSYEQPKCKILKNSKYYLEIDPNALPKESKQRALYEELEKQAVITKDNWPSDKYKYKITFNRDYEFSSPSRLISFLRCKKNGVNGWEWLGKLLKPYGNTALIDFDNK